MIKLTYHEIYSWDGGDRHNGSGICFETEEEALKYVELNPHMSTKYDVIKERTVTVYKTVSEYINGELDRKKQKALDKLTKEERQILGLE